MSTFIIYTQIQLSKTDACKSSRLCSVYSLCAHVQAKKIDSIFTILINLCFYLGYEKCQIISFLLYRSIMYPAFSLKVKCPYEMLTLCSLLANKNIFLPKFSSLRTCTYNLQEAQCRLTKNTKNKTRLLVSHE